MLDSDFLALSGLVKNARELEWNSHNWERIRSSLEGLSKTDDEDEVAKLVADILGQVRDEPARTIKGLKTFTIPGVGEVGRIIKRGVRVGHVQATGKALHAELVRLGIGRAHDFIEKSAPASVGLDAPLSVAQRTINAWITERPEGLKVPLVQGETCRLNFNVGVPQLGSLLPETAIIPMADIPERGLETVWMVVGDGADLGPIDKVVEISRDTADGRAVSVAVFDLLIPRDADSDTVAMSLTPHTASPHLHVLIFVKRQVYRSFDIALTRTDLGMFIRDTGEVVFTDPDHGYLPLSHERVLAYGTQMNLLPPFEWTTPPGELTVWLTPDRANVFGDVHSAAGSKRVGSSVPIPNSTAILAGLINNVRLSAEKFRDRHGAYLDAIDPADLNARLQQWQATNYDWQSLHYENDGVHASSWDVVARSPELHAMAIEGYRLFREMFKGALMDWLGSLLPGHRVNILSLPGPSVIPNIPFGLMYVLDPPKQGESIDAMGFAGLRFRLEYRAHDVTVTDKGLISGSSAQRVNIMYWGDNAADPVLREANVQRTAWTALPYQTFVPATASANPRKEVIDTLENPQPAPVATLYFFCHCSVGRGNTVMLEFTDAANAAQPIESADLGVSKLADGPLVFANACATAASDPYIANLLETEFFSRECRGFIGTETKVPITLASRFADVFFRFFERRLTKEPISAGESIAQTRLFLWTHYRNIGGLFYTYINQYELFMATNAEVEDARAG